MVINLILLGLSIVLLAGIVCMFTIVDKVSDCYTYKETMKDREIKKAKEELKEYEERYFAK